MGEIDGRKSNMIIIKKLKRGYSISGNHECHGEVIAENGIEILGNLREFAKYFFPESFSYDCSGSGLDKRIISGINSFQEGYNLGASHYLNLQCLLFKANNMIKKGSEIIKNYERG